MYYTMSRKRGGDPRWPFLVRDRQYAGKAKEMGRVQLDIDAIRAQIRTMDFERGTSDEIAQWHEDDRDSRHNLVIEGMCPEPIEDRLFAMMLDEGVSPALASKLVVDMIQTGTGKLSV